MLNAEKRYFAWLCDLVRLDDDLYMDQERAGSCSYYNLFKILFDMPFIWKIPMDKNRAADGLALRTQFLKLVNTPGYYTRQNGKMVIRNETYDFVVNSHIEDCSVLEVMIALAQRIEYDIMHESRYGDRTKKWFWIMINSLGLENQNDRMFDIDFVEGVLVRFIDRKYHIDGKGSLFYIPDCMYDLRTVDIWTQANKFLIYYDIDKLFD